MNEWKWVTNNTEMLDVRGGRIYKYREINMGISMVFVPDEAVCPECGIDMTKMCVHCEIKSQCEGAI